MKPLLRIIFVLTALAAGLPSIRTAAQVADAGLSASPASSASQAPRPSWDRDIQALRNNIDPNFSHTYDDYILYSPAVLMVGLKTCGYKGRSSWGRMLASDAFSTAIMISLTKGLKWSINRPRPNGGRHSMPSGHTATAFMTASMLHHEYGWRSPWWSFAGYSVATVTSVSRILNNRHWMSDTFAGAVIGVGSTELGYFLADLIFTDKGLYADYLKPEFSYCSTDNGYYSIQAGYDRRFIVAAGKENIASSTMPYRGSNASLAVEFPLLSGSGICVEGVAGSLLFKDESSYNVYAGRVGLFWERDFAKVLELEVQTLVGYAGHRNGGGIDLSAAASLNLVTGNNFKLRALAQWETFSFATRDGSTGKPFLNSILLGYRACFFW